MGVRKTRIGGSARRAQAPRWSGLPAVSSAEATRVARGSSSAAHAGDGDEGCGHAIAEGDGARLVEQQRVDIAGGLDGAARRGDDVDGSASGPCPRCQQRTAGRRWSGDQQMNRAPRMAADLDVE